MHRVTECKASPDYKLWLKFDDGLEGCVFLGDLLEVGAFSAWRDADRFCRVAVDRKSAAVGWGGGGPPGPRLPAQGLLSEKTRKEFNGSGAHPRRLKIPHLH